MSKRIRIILFFCVLIVLMSCSSMRIDKVKQQPSLTISVAVSTPVLTLPQTAFARPTDTVRRIIVPSDIPELEYTPTAFSPSITPLATLSTTESNGLVLDLLLNNAGCQYPCWWGITPGKTSWSEANHFLTSFVEVISFVSKNSSTGEPTYLIRYPLQNEREGGGFNIYVKDNQITIIFVGRDSTKQNSLLHQILAKYGSPEKIYIQIIKNVPSDDLPLTLVLFYANRNFLVVYEMTAHANNDKLVSCTNDESPGLFLWSDNEIVDEQRIQDWTLGVDPIIPLKPLEDVTDLDIKSFTEIFSTTQFGGACLTTKKDNWNVEQ